MDKLSCVEIKVTGNNWIYEINQRVKEGQCGAWKDDLGGISIQKC